LFRVLSLAIVLSLSVLMVLPGTYTPVRAINQTNPLRFSPFGPFTQQMIIHFYSDFTVMFQHFQLGEIDISDWPLQSSADISTFCSNADFFCTSPQPQLGYFGQELNSHTPFMGIALTQARTTSPPSYTTTSTTSGCGSGFGSLTVTVRNQETNLIVLDPLNTLTVANQPSGSPSAAVSDSGGSTPNGVYNVPCILAGTYSLRSSVYNATGTTVAIASATTTSGTLNVNWNSPSNVRPTRNRALLGAAIAHLLDDPEFVSSTFGPVASAPCAFMVVAQGQVCPAGTTSSYQCLLPPLSAPVPCPASNPLGGTATQNDNAECQFVNHPWLNVVGCLAGAAGHDLGPYNSADDKLVYSTGWVLFDKKDPTKVRARSEERVFAPDKDWERVGQVPNVVFVEGMVRDGKRWLFYYRGADKNVGVATAPALKGLADLFARRVPSHPHGTAAPQFWRPRRWRRASGPTP